MFLKRNDLRLIGAEVRDSCGSSGTGETPQAFTPRRLTARPAESEHLEGKSTTTHYLVNSNKVWENSLLFSRFETISLVPIFRMYPAVFNVKQVVPLHLGSESGEE
ncbi:hypothetical protein QNH26_25090 [Peribacillus frigoritolerans]|uniref:hypothetical protein n=1 Tax=Peribacillus frigoritolerans TaxID=450367 RepID=UPI0024C15C60|nr:hypothetical protein [Peribacillus frigoritolerans]WHX66839.1 hypothetical protein QNH26_25090 [Peribacillus frigoritolerans]